MLSMVRAIKADVFPATSPSRRAWKSDSGVDHGS
jgi:hypothetical protein